MQYNFDQVIDRKNTYSLKYDFADKRGMPKDILPFWVADMDFRAPQEVLDALSQTVAHGIFGYSDSMNDYSDAVCNWFKTYFDWHIDANWIVKTPGIVFAINVAIRAFTEPGDAILIQEPVYYPFKASITANERKPIINTLCYKDNTYTIDFKDFEQKIINNNVKLFILCSPHNPVGRVWTKEELLHLGDICLKHNVLVISDEIHADFTYEGYTHHVFSNLNIAFEDITITCTAPSKTFNLAGLQISNIFIPNEKLRSRFKEEYDRTGYCELNIMGMVGCRAAYEHGHEWLRQLKEYLKGNLDFTREFVNTHLDGVTLVEPEGTYLVWLDFSEYIKKNNLTYDELNQIIIHKANLWLDNGLMFGNSGSTFQRINITCPRETLHQGLTQLANAL